MSLLRLKMHSPSQLISYRVCLRSSMILAFRCAQSWTCWLSLLGCADMTSGKFLFSLVWDCCYLKKQCPVSMHRYRKCISVLKCSMLLLLKHNECESGWILNHFEVSASWAIFSIARHVFWLTAEMIAYHLCDKGDEEHPDGCFIYSGRLMEEQRERVSCTPAVLLTDLIQLTSTSSDQEANIVTSGFMFTCTVI